MFDHDRIQTYTSRSEHIHDHESLLKELSLRSGASSLYHADSEQNHICDCAQENQILVENCNFGSCPFKGADFVLFHAKISFAKKR